MARAPRYLPAEYRSRPSDYSPRLVDDILARVDNGELLTDICDDQDMPLPGTFLRWCREDARLQERYREAQHVGNEVRFDQAASEAFGSDPYVARVRSDALRWHVERSQPERYGPRALVKEQRPEDDAGAGIDYSAELRRRIEQMAERTRAAEETAS